MYTIHISLITFSTTAPLWGKEKVCTGFWWGNLRKRDHLENPGLDGRIILKLGLKKMGCEGMDWSDVAPDRDRWRALVKVIINLRVPKYAWNF